MYCVPFLVLLFRGAHVNPTWVFTLEAPFGEWRVRKDSYMKSLFHLFPFSCSSFSLLLMKLVSFSQPYRWISILFLACCLRNNISISIFCIWAFNRFWMLITVFQLFTWTGMHQRKMIPGFEPWWKISLLRPVLVLSFLIQWIFQGDILLSRTKQICLWYRPIYVSIFHLVPFLSFLICKIRQQQHYNLEMQYPLLPVPTLIDYGCPQKVVLINLSFIDNNLHSH